MDPLLLDVPRALETERLLLRCPQAGDGVAFFRGISESTDDMLPWLRWPREITTVEVAEAKIRKREVLWLQREAFHALAFEKSSGAFVGSISLAHIEWFVPKCEIGYWVVASQANKGFATEGTRAWARFAFDVLKMRRVQIRTEPANVRSRRVAERAGFVHEANLKNEIPGRNEGEVCDALVYAMTR